MRCAVFNCDNNNKDNESSIRFYCFPKDKVLRKQWVHFCRRKDQFNVKTSRICCAHFAPDDIERNLQFEMGMLLYFSLNLYKPNHGKFAGLCQKNGYKLKPGTIPTIDPKAETVSLSSRSNRMQARATQEMIACLIQQTPAPAEATETQEAEKEPTVAEEKDCTSNDSFVEISTETLKDRITSLENEV